MFDPEHIMAFFGSAIEHDATKFGAAFTLAAWVHSGRVRKEIRTQMGELKDSLKDSFQEMIGVVKQDLNKQGERMDKLEGGVNKLNTRVDALEKPNGG